MADPFTISFLMKMITDRVDMMLTRGLTLERVTASQGRVLAYLMSRDGENVSQRDIERHLGVSHTCTRCWRFRSTSFLGRRAYSTWGMPLFLP